MNEPHADSDAPATAPQPLNALQRRILGVLIEKARTTPDAYPLSLNGLVTGCNQKSNRSPVMNVTPEQVEDELFGMRDRGIVAEVHGGGRVPKYRHYGYDYLGVKGVEAGVMTELLLRGEQTAGDLRSRASRFERIADLGVMQQILDDLQAKHLVVALTPPGRGQLFTHTLYEPQELDRLTREAGRRAPAESAGSTPSPTAPAATPSAASGNSPTTEELTALQTEVAELRLQVQQLSDRIARLES